MTHIFTSSEIGLGGTFSGHRHDFDIPEGYGDYLVFCSIRCPFSRAISLWSHRLREIRWNMHKGMHPRDRRKQPIPYDKLSLDDFLKRLTNGGIEDFYKFTIKRWLKWVPTIDQHVRVEHLQEDFNQLYFIEEDIQLPKLNKTEHGPWQDYYNPSRIELVRTWAKEDFKELGYKDSLK